MKQPQEADAVPPSGVPKVFGVLSIVLGALVFFLTLFGGCVALASQGGDGSSWIYSGLQNAEERAKIYNRFYERTRAASVTQTAVYAIMSGLLVVIGIGQLGYRAWARRLSVYWGGVALVSLVVNTALGLLVVRPANQLLLQELQRVTGKFEAALTSMFSSWSTSSWMILGSAIVYAPYPILLIYFFSRRQMRSDMTR